MLLAPHTHNATYQHMGPIWEAIKQAKRKQARMTNVQHGNKGKSGHSDMRRRNQNDAGIEEPGRQILGWEAPVCSCSIFS